MVAIGALDGLGDLTLCQGLGAVVELLHHDAGAKDIVPAVLAVLLLQLQEALLPLRGILDGPQLLGDLLGQGGLFLHLRLVQGLAGAQVHGADEDVVGGEDAVFLHPGEHFLVGELLALGAEDGLGEIAVADEAGIEALAQVHGLKLGIEILFGAVFAAEIADVVLVLGLQLGLFLFIQGDALFFCQALHRDEGAHGLLGALVHQLRKGLARLVGLAVPAHGHAVALVHLEGLLHALGLVVEGVEIILPGHVLSVDGHDDLLRRMEGIDGLIIHTAGLHLGFFGSSFRLVGRLSGGLDGLRRGGGLVGLCQQVAVGEAQHPDHEDAQHQQPDKQLFHILSSFRLECSYDTTGNPGIQGQIVNFTLWVRSNRPQSAGPRPPRGFWP